MAQVLQQHFIESCACPRIYPATYMLAILTTTSSAKLIPMQVNYSLHVFISTFLFSYGFIFTILVSVVITLAGGNGGVVAGSTNGFGTFATFNKPCGVGVDLSGNLYVGEYDGYNVRKVSAVGGICCYSS